MPPSARAPDRGLANSDMSKYIPCGSNTGFDKESSPGESNPADLFTKHLESRGKLDLLVRLFGCEFREGMPAAAPALRREGLGRLGLDGLEEDEGLYTTTTNELPDPDVLPHHHPHHELVQLFPAATLPEIIFGKDDPHHRPGYSEDMPFSSSGLEGYGPSARA